MNVAWAIVGTLAVSFLKFVLELSLTKGILLLLMRELQHKWLQKGQLRF